MAIGDVPLRLGRQASQNPAVVPGQFGEGVARALGSLSNNLKEAQRNSELLMARDNAKQLTEIEKSWVTFVGESGRTQAAQLAAAPPGATGITNQVSERINASTAAFLATVPDHLKENFAVRAETLIQSQTTGAFNFEFTEGTALMVRDVRSTLDFVSGELYQENMTYAEATQAMANIISVTDLPPTQQALLAQEAEAKLLGIDYGNQWDAGLSSQIPVTPPTGENVVAGGVSPGQRGVLNTISGPESGGKYNVRYGGVSGSKTFTDYSAHPRIYEMRPDGRPSSAAGRYQIVYSTWINVKEALNLPDFSPVSQDRAALYLARERYNRSVPSGSQTFDEVLAGGDPDSIKAMRSVLLPEWEGLSKLTDDEWLEGILGASGIEGGGTGTVTAPNIFSDPRYASLSFDQKLKISTDTATAFARQEKAAQAAAAAAHKESNNQALIAASTGQIGAAQFDELVEGGILSTLEERNKYNAAVEAYDTEVGNALRIGERMENPNSIFTSADNEDFNSWLGDDAIAAVENLDNEYTGRVLGPAIISAGYIPTAISSVLEAQINSGNPKHRDWALGVVGGLADANPNILSQTAGLSANTKARINFFSTYKPFLTEERMNEMLTSMNDPVALALRTDAISAGLREFDAEVSDADMLNNLDTMFSWQVAGPPSNLQMDRMRREYRDNYAFGWSVNAEDKSASEYANRQIEILWGATDIGGERHYIRTGPEKYYPTIDGGHSWIDKQIRSRLNLGEDTIFSLAPDGRTVAEATAQQLTGEGLGAGYQVQLKNAEGLWLAVLNEDGTPLRMTFDPNSEEITRERDNIIASEAFKREVDRLDEVMQESGLMRIPENQWTLEEQVIAEEFKTATELYQRNQYFIDRQADRDSFSQGTIDTKNRMLTHATIRSQEMFKRLQDGVGFMGLPLDGPGLHQSYDQLLEEIRWMEETLING